MAPKNFMSSVFCFMVLIGLLFFQGLAGKAHADDILLKIEGQPLEIHAYEDSTMGVFRWQDGTLVQQYYGQYSKGSIIFLNGDSAYYRWGGAYFSIIGPTPVSHSKPDESTIETVFDAGSTGVRITQTISYQNGNSYYQIVWRIANMGSETFNDVRFIHEGDTYFAGDDYSEGHWNEDLGMIYLTNPNPALTGIMGLYGGIDSRADHYVEDFFTTARSHATSGSLPDTVVSDYHDAAYALQWNRASLAPGQVWTITAFEKWTESGYVQVIAPAQTAIAPGQSVSLNFQIQNYQPVQDTFDLLVTSEAGWTVSLPEGDAVTIPADSMVTVQVILLAPADAPGDFVDTVTLTATSRSDPQIFNSDAVALVVTQQPITDTATKPIGPGTGVSDYEMMSFVYTPLNPAATSVIGLPEDPNNLRMGTYDPHTGGYIEYGDELLITPGRAYWALSREGFTVSLAGEEVPLEEDFEFELAYHPSTGNGWNQIGCPNYAAYEWGNVLVVVHNDGGEIVFGPIAISELADSNEYIDLRLWRWENGAYLDDTDLMAPYEGYWVKTRYPYVSLIFPADAQLDPGLSVVRKNSFRKKNIAISKKSIFSPRIAIADSGDSPPMPMASLSYNDTGASAAGGCFIDAAGQRF